MSASSTSRRLPESVPPLIVACLFVTLTGALPTTAAHGADDPGTEAVESESEALAGVTEVVVALQGGVTVEPVAADHGLTPVRRLAGSRDVHLLAVPAGSDVTRVSASLSADSRVRFAEPNYAGGMPEGNPNYAWGATGARWVGTDPSAWQDQPALQRIGVQAAHEVSTGAGTIVAVLDTGVQAEHPSLAGRLAAGGVDLVDGDSTPSDVADGIDEDGDGLVDEALGHGTHVTGIVLAVAPDSRVLPVRVLTSDGIGFAFDVAEGVRYAVAAGADVVNLSLGSTADSELLREVLAEAAEQVTVVASAGNDATTQHRYPAAYADVVSVASVDDADQRSVFSNAGWVDVAAPGEDIVSTYPQDGFAAWDGTSMAAPLVSGQAALLVAAGTEKAAASVRSTAVEVDPDLGAGRIDVAASLAAASAAD
jgi:thermitase